MSKLPKAVGPYSTHRISNGLLFASGQLPLDPETNQIVGDTIDEQTKQVFKNIAALLASEGLKYENIVKTTVFLDDIQDFGAMNEIYGQHFEAPFPARSAIEVANIPLNALVEIEFIAEIN